jgi:hypothetical protein
MPNYLKPLKHLWKIVLFGLLLFFLPDLWTAVATGLQQSALIPADSIKLLFQTLGGAFIGAAALLYIVQMPFYQEDITRFFKSAFTDPKFIAQLDDEIKIEIFQTALKARYQRQCEADLLDEFSEILTHTEKPYYLKLETLTKVKISADKTIRIIRRSLKIKHNGKTALPLLEFINQSTSRNVYLHTGNDSRVIKEVELAIGNFRKKVLIPEGQRVDEQVTGSEELGYSSRSTVNWSKLAEIPGSGDLKEVIVKPGQVVDFTYDETITTGVEDVEVAFRLRYFSKGIKATVTLENLDGKDRKLKGTLLGNLPDRHSFDIRDFDGSLTCETDRWLIPGSGYHIYFYVDC